MKKEIIQKSKKKDFLLKNSTVEYLTFIASTGNDSNSVEMRYEDENIWLTQKMLAELYNVSIATINEHLKNIFSSGELDENSVIRKFLITASDGKNYETKHYDLQVIIAVGFKVNSQKAVQFRKWVNQIAKEYTELEFEKYRIVQDRMFESDFDRFFEEN